MTREETIAHWQKGAKDALEVARLAHGKGKYSLALFHCHLAVEKALKAAFIADKDTAPPATHDLFDLAHTLKRSWQEDDRTALDALSDFAILARYGDETWEERQATEEASTRWIAWATQFLSLIP